MVPCFMLTAVSVSAPAAAMAACISAGAAWRGDRTDLRTTPSLQVFLGIWGGQPCSSSCHLPQCRVMPQRRQSVSAGTTVTALPVRTQLITTRTASATVFSHSTHPHTHPLSSSVPPSQHPDTSDNSPHCCSVSTHDSSALTQFLGLCTPGSAPNHMHAHAAHSTAH